MSGSLDRNVLALPAAGPANGSERGYFVQNGQDVQGDIAALLAGRTVPGPLGIAAGTLQNHAATVRQLQDAIASLLGGATQAQLDTIADLAAALGNNPDAVATLTAAISAKASNAALAAAVARIASLEAALAAIGAGGGTNPTPTPATGTITGPTSVVPGQAATFQITLNAISTGYAALSRAGVQQGGRTSRPGSGPVLLTPSVTGDFVAQLWSAASGGLLLAEWAFTSTNPSNTYVADGYVAPGYVA